MSSWGVTVTDPQILDWLRGQSRVVKNANKRAVRAAVNVFLMAAMQIGVGYAAAGPQAALLGQRKGYRVHVDSNAANVVKGTLGSRYPGSIIEVGSKAHWVLNKPEIVAWALRHGRQELVKQSTVRVTRGGRSWYVNLAANPDLVAWLVAHEALNADGSPRFFHQKDMPARPTVVPGAQASEERATDAYEAVMFAAIEADV